MNQSELTQALKKLLEQRSAPQPVATHSLVMDVKNSLSTFNLYPNSTANDYLKHTSACRSLNKALASDWDKVGKQLWAAYQQISAATQER